jgi:hypothetical protein
MKRNSGTTERQDGLPLEPAEPTLQREAAGPGAESTAAVDGPAAPAEPVSSGAASDQTLAGHGPEAGYPTPEQIAERVYELFCRDLRVLRERKGI